MRKNLICSVAGVLVLLGVANCANAQQTIFERFPEHAEFGVLCWTVPGGQSGSISQILILRTTAAGAPELLWQSALDSSYSPRVRFMPQIRVHGTSLAFVERQTGAGSFEVDIIGKSAAGFTRLFHADGFRFDLIPLDGSKLPVIIAHRDASILDVPRIYRWNGSRFVDDSFTHPSYYRKLLGEDRKAVPADASAPVLINLSRIALLAGEPTAARRLLREAHAKQRSQ